MANSHETTFKTLQMDERYKKLERTLKMVLLKNSDRRNTSTWPSVSSINGDNFDTSCAAMSIQSSRVGSEVVASSANFRKATQSHNKYHDSPRLKMVTSSENQFSTKKDATDDSAMMPPPSTPGSWFTRSKRFGKDSQHAPLHNMPLNPTKNKNGFAMSTPSSSVSSIIKQTGSMSIDTNTVYQGDDKYGRKVYEENTNDNSSQPRQRIFSRWRVLLNDKGLLIIKGTLECGKIARSKPVIRRLTATSVQSKFKHTYHLQGNLVDERNELPDYVRGKFFNGFPDDWENVYQVWQNYRSDGSRLSFHWPTAVTDSDDDIKSGITEISYNGKHKKSVSPRKRAGSKASSVCATSERNAENPSDPNRCSCSHNASFKPPETSSRVHSRLNRDEDGMNVSLEEKKKVHETSSRSLNTTDKLGALSLKDILQEDKLNIIIDNLTNKNCSIEYLKKVVEMFDSLKYVVSYQSTEENYSDKDNSVSQEKEISRRPKKENRPTEENHESQSAKSRSNNLHNPTAKIDRCENTLSNFGNGFASRIAEKSYEDQHDGQARRILTKRNDDSSESENDCHNDNRRPTTYRPPSSHERMRRSHKHNKNYENAIVTRASVRHSEPKKSIEGSHRARKCNVPPASRSNIPDSSLSEEEPVEDRRVEQKTQHKRAFASPRKCRNAERDPRRRVTHHDSSVSITEDESDSAKKSKPKAPYDSNVDCSSLSEDEHGDTDEGRRFEALKHYPVSNSRPVEPDSSGTVDIRGDRKKLESSKHPESVFRPVDPVMSRKTSKQDTPRETPKFAEPMTVDPPAKNPVNNGVGINNFANEQDDDSAYLSSEIKRAKRLEINRGAVETATRKAHADSRSNDQQLDQPSMSSEIPAPKRKSPQARKKPIVVSCELTNINLKSHNWLHSNGGNENDKNACNTQRVCVDKSKVNPAPNDAKNAPVSQKTPVDTLSKPANIAGPVVTKSTNEEAKVALNAPDGRSLTKKNKSEKAGSQVNPKLLTAWVPAVVCNDKGRSKYHLIFEGKLLNEAGHVINRKFATDFIRRRVTAKLVETINQEFYELVGDFNDTKHVVPKELVKLCRSGCPGRISQFCERWTALTAELNKKNQLRDLPHNTTLDCLGVPTSSRGRSIVPPLNYWTGERIATKDNKAFYSPGNALELTIPSALDSTNDEIRDKKSEMSKVKQVQNSLDQNGKRTDESKATGTKRKEAGKVSSSKPALQNPSQPEKRRISRGGKRRLSKNVQASSSESEADEQTKPIPRKRKARTTDRMLNTESTPTRKLRNASTNNAASSQNLKSTNASSGQGSLEKLPETELKAKLRKRQKIDYDQSPVTPTTSKQFTTRRKSVVTCTYYKNVPIRDDDFSEDQLSTM